MRPGASFAISVVRGVGLSGLLICLLPLLFGPEMIWFAMPITELAIAAAVTALMRKSQKALA